MWPFTRRGPNPVESASPIAALASRIIEDAYVKGASHIHIEPAREQVRVRYRVDGLLEQRMEVPRQALDPLLDRIKVMANLEPRRVPQSGRLVFRPFSRTGLDLELGVSIWPLLAGEKAVLELRCRGSISLGLDALGFSAKNLELMRWATRLPSGLVLFSGLGGSGKGTTFYAAISEIEGPDVNIQMFEDGIVYPLEGVNQRADRELLGRCRDMDPDVVVIDEILDKEKATLALEEALRGRLVFATLLASRSVQALHRLLDMGVEPFLVSEGLAAVCCQRLEKRICRECRGDRRDCERCHGTGKKGRVGIHEVLVFNDELRALILKRADDETLRAAALKNGIRTLDDDACAKKEEGLIS